MSIRFQVLALGAVFLCVSAPPSLAGTTIVGERVEFSPQTVRAGEQVTATAVFRIEGDPVTLTLGVVVTTTPPTAAPPAPSVVLGRLEAGRHTFRFPYTVPSPPPARVCFEFRSGTQAILDAACLEGALTVAGSGQPRTTTLSAPPRPAVSTADAPDLAVISPSVANACRSVKIGSWSYPLGRGKSTTEIHFTAANYGGVAATNVAYRVTVQYDEITRRGEEEYSGQPVHPDITHRTIVLPGTVERIESGQLIPVRARVDLHDRAFVCGLAIWSVIVEIDPDHATADRVRANNRVSIGNPPHT